MEACKKMIVNGIETLASARIVWDENRFPRVDDFGVDFHPPVGEVSDDEYNRIANDLASDLKSK